MNEPIRVLQNIQTISFGGVETFVMNYYRNIDRTKVQFDFIVRMYDNMPNNFEKEILSLGGKIYNIPTFKGGKLFFIEIIKLLKNNKNYNIIHSHSNIYSVYALFSAKCANVQFRIAHCHNTSANHGLLYPFKMLLKPFVKSLSTNRFACSVEAGKWLFGKKDFQLVPNAVDTEKFKFNLESRIKKREELELDNEFTVINIGRFTEQKNQLFVLDIFVEILKIKKNSKLILVGDGELKKDIKAKISDLNLESKVILLGIRTDISELLNASDVFILPSLFEGLPFTLIEAQSTGIKCVVSDKVPIDAKLLDNYDIIPLKDNQEDFAKCACKDNILDRSFASEIVKCKGFDIKKAAKELEEFYLSLHK